jgi:glyoxylase-like metal-dependent hydrolase (beta-lactamase superfamily II)
MQIVTIDCGYTRPQFAAAYLVHDGKRALFIDNNTTHSVPRLLEALRSAGLTAEAVVYVIITHVHLDHAGGSSALMKACPRATLLGHPRAVTHVVDPSRLVASATAVYGKDHFESLYGTIEPVDGSRVRAVQDQEEILFGDSRLKFLFTRGHANHHICIVLAEPGGEASRIFTGDAFGLAYPALQKSGLFIIASTSPTDFDALEAKKSIQAILATGASEAFLTHYGPIKALGTAAAELTHFLDFSHDLIENACAENISKRELPIFFEAALRSHIHALLKKHELSLSGETAALLKMDIELNAQGLAHVTEKQRTRREQVGTP